MSLSFLLARIASRLPRGGFALIRWMAKLMPELTWQRIETVNGSMFCDLTESVCYPLHKHGYYPHATEEQALFRKLVGPRDVVVDVGANVGFFTRLFASRAAEVHAFEPAQRALKMLRANVSDFENVTIHPICLSDIEGQILFEQKTALDTSSVGSGSLTGVSTLDACGVQPTFIKIDVEGHEQQVLRGAIRCLSSGPTIVYEALSDSAREEIETIIFDANPNYRFKSISPYSRNFLAATYPLIIDSN